MSEDQHGPLLRWAQAIGDDNIVHRIEALVADNIVHRIEALVAENIVHRIEALVAENAELRAGLPAAMEHIPPVNPSEGRVPVSWDECADWLDAGGVVLLVHDDGATVPAATTAAEFRIPDFLKWAEFDYFRLLPPSGLVAAPEGMDGGGWLGQGKDVPDGWEWRIGPNQEFFTDEPLGNFVQCRPPVRVRAVVEVPLTRLVGRTIEGCEDAVTGYRTGCLGVEWLNSRGGWFSFPAGSLDLDTGRVKVEPEGEQ